MHPPDAYRLALVEAVAGLYRTFSGYALRIVQGCPHCVDGDDQRALRRAPLDQLTGQDLDRYAFKALTTWGDADDLRHFLPRLLELTASGQLGVDPEIVLGKLQLARWRTWPAPEREAIRTFLAGWWRQTITAFPAPHDVATVLCAIAQVVDDLAPFLSTWLEQRPAEPAARHLADFVNDVAHSAGHRRGGPVHTGNAWWRERPAQRAQVIVWLARASVGEVLEQAFFDAVSSSIATELSVAVDQLAWIATLNSPAT